MKNLSIKIVAACLFLSMQSCEHILDQAEEKRAQENFTSEFMGKWTGSYSGDINGSLTVIVAKNAGAEVIRSTSGNPDSYYTNLVMSSFNTGTKSPQGFVIQGNLQAKNGTWEMGNLKGTWTLNKN